MKKQILVLSFILVFFLLATSAFALGLGVSAGLPIGQGMPGNNVMVSLKLDNFPLLIGAGAQIGSHYSSIGLTLDYWIANKALTGPLNWYIGAGAYGIIGLGSPSSLDIGARIPIGLNLFVFDGVLELFTELAPALGVGISDPLRFPVLGVQSAFGFRIWF